MLSRRTCLATAAGAALAAPLAGWRTAEPTRAQGLATMARATRFITDEVAVAGGNVWFYLTDLSRRWGEMEACPTMMRPQASASVATLVLGLNAEAYGQVELQTTSHPHRGPGPCEPPAGFVDRGQVGDARWASPPKPTSTP